MRHSLYKYFSERTWAETFLNGEVLFRSLAYFRDQEDNNVRGDQDEGTAIFRPKGGLVIDNQTQGKTFTFRHHSFESTANQEEIFVFCTSRSLKEELREKFSAVVCVEILNIKAFCARIENALPPNAKFPGPLGRPRIGRSVEYYDESEGGNRRWALPDVIATSKRNDYAWQDEFRLVFCLTDALEFEKADYRLVPNDTKRAPNPAEHRDYRVRTQSLRDICRLHEFVALTGGSTLSSR